MQKNTTKKIKAIIALASLFISMLPGIVLADTAEFGQNSYSVAPDTDFTVVVNATDFVDVDTVDLLLEYDPNVISFVSATDGVIMSPAMMIVNTFPSGPNEQLLVSLSAFMSPINGDGELTTITFHSSASGGNTNISFVTFDIVHPDFSMTSGTTGLAASVTVPVPDTTNPIISINNPTINATYSYTNASNILTLAGTATDNNTVSSVSYSVDTGDSGVASGTENWSADISLTEGENIVTVTAVDSIGNVGTDTLTINYAIPAPAGIAFSQTDINTSIDSDFTVTINATDFYNVDTVDLVLEYNPNIISYTSATEGVLMSPAMIIDSIGINGQNETLLLSISAVMSPINGDGELATVTFHSTANGGSTNVAIASFDIVHADLTTSTGTIGSMATVSIPVPDTTAPVRSAGLPSGSQSSNTTQATLSLTTNESATCKYSTTADVTYDLQTNVFATTGATTHSTVVTGLSSGTYNYYVKCVDLNNNKNTDDYIINFSIQQPAASGGSGGSGGGGGATAVATTDTTPTAQPVSVTGERLETQITIKWKNPVDSDFDKIVIIKSNDLIDSYMTLSAALGIGTKVYEGNAQEYIDKNIDPLSTYYYAIYSLDKKANATKPVVITKSKISADNKTNVATTNQTTTQTVKGDYVSADNLIGADSETVEVVTMSEATKIYSQKTRVALNEDETRLYNKVYEKKHRELTDDEKYRLAHFIKYGTETTKKLGSGECAGVVNSYNSVFGKLPTTEEEWQDVIKIANGRWPNERNVEAEDETKSDRFKKIYKREANMSNANDNAAVTVMTYGLRPADRKLQSEMAGMRIFKGIYKYNPTSAQDWDIVRAIAYSGATR